MSKTKSKAPKPSDEREYISLRKAADLLPTRVSHSAIWRWCLQGIKAPDGSIVKMRYVRFGKRLFTTVSWVDEFGDILAEANERQISKNLNTMPTKAKARQILAERGLF